MGLMVKMNGEGGSYCSKCEKYIDGIRGGWWRRM